MTDIIYNRFLVEPQRNENEPDNLETRFEACRPKDAEVWAVLGRRGVDWEVLEDFDTPDEAIAFAAGCEAATARLLGDEGRKERSAHQIYKVVMATTRVSPVNGEWQDRIVAKVIEGNQWITDSTTGLEA